MITPNRQRTSSTNDSAFAILGSPVFVKPNHNDEGPGYRQQMFHSEPFGIDDLKYPPDAPGEEMSSRARVWRVYLDETERLDHDLINGWNHSLDVLLVFTGLFSAVVTTFVVQSSQALQPDYTQITANLLIELVALNRDLAQGISSNITARVEPSSFTPSVQTRWINGLWFTSLVLSLVLALVAVLIKQWLQAYVADISGSPKERARIRSFRYSGILKWRVPGIISTLPLLMHAALFLFLMGLIQFLVSLDQIISWILISIVSPTYVLIIISSFLPLLCIQCPYRTPLSENLATLRVYLILLLFEINGLISQLKHFIKFPLHSDHHMFPCSNISDTTFPSKDIFHTLRSKELTYVAQTGDVLDAGIVTWLATTSVDPRVVLVALQALAGLNANFEGFESIHKSGLVMLIEQAFQKSIPDVDKFNSLSQEEIHEAEKYGRALYHLFCWLGPRARLQSGENLHRFQTLPSIQNHADIKTLGICAIMRFLQYGQKTTRLGLSALKRYTDNELPGLSTNSLILLLDSIADSTVTWGPPLETSIIQSAMCTFLKLLDMNGPNFSTNYGMAFARAFHYCVVPGATGVDLNTSHERPEDLSYARTLQSLLVVFNHNRLDEHLPLASLHISKMILNVLTNNDLRPAYINNANSAITSLTRFIVSNSFSLKHIAEPTLSNIMEIFLRSPSETPREDARFLHNLVEVLHAAAEERTHFRALLLMQRCVDHCSLSVCRVFCDANGLQPMHQHLIKVPLLASTIRRIVASLISSIATHAVNEDVEAELDYLLHCGATGIICERLESHRISLYEIDTVWLPPLVDLCHLRPNYPGWPKIIESLMESVRDVIAQEEKQLIDPDQRFFGLAGSVSGKFDQMKFLVGIDVDDVTFLFPISREKLEDIKDGRDTQECFLVNELRNQ